MDLNNYFKDIAETHTDILHTEEKPSFFREYSSARVLLDNTFHANLRYAGDNVLVAQFNDDGQIPPPQDDFNRDRRSGSLFILSRIKDKDKEAARLKAIEIRNDILAKFYQDARTKLIPKQFVINDIGTTTIGQMADNFFGIMLTFSFSDKYLYAYNSEKWISA